MRALFLTASYPTREHPLLGIFVKEHARAVAAHAEVAVVHLDRAPVSRLRLTEAEGEEFPTWRVRYPRSPAPVSYLGNALAAALGYGRARFVPDVIHAHFFLAAAPAVVLGRALRKPVVVTEQWSVFLPDDPMTLSRPMRRVARFAFEHADVVMPVSEALRDGIRAIGARGDFRVVPNVVDTARFHPDGPRRDGLVGVGGLYGAKGWEDLLEALALLKGRGRAVAFDLFGDGELRAQLEARASRLGVDGLVAFHGWRPKDEVAERLRSANVFVLPSRYDSNPCAVIEALASGVPVVATAVGGIPEMVPEGEGLLVPPGSPGRVAEAIEQALDRTWDRAAIARAARGRYGSERVGADFAAIYEEAIARRRR